MKMFRSALAGVLPAFVLSVAIQFGAGAASTPQSLAVQPWLTGDDSVSHHIWLPVGTLSNCDTQFTAPFAAPSESRQLSFEDRVAYQRAIEEVYWRHRIWPKERPDPKPSLDAVMSQATIEQKVQNYLRGSELLEEEWQKPVTPGQLQSEMDRMAQHGKQPEVLRELFAALGNDPFVIAECLARPVLLEHLQFAKAERGEEPLGSWRARAQQQMPTAMAAANPNYTLPGISAQASDCIDDSWTPTSTTNAPIGRANHAAVWTGSEMIVWGGLMGIFTELNTGGRYNPGTDSWTATSTTNAPIARDRHKAVWTGTEMIVWGGGDGINIFNTGGRYCAQAGSPTITLDTTARKVAGINTVGLTWSGATSTNIDVYRDAVLIVTTANDGFYIDSTGDTGRARYTYQVCEAGTQVCSNEETVVFNH